MVGVSRLDGTMGAPYGRGCRWVGMVLDDAAGGSEMIRPRQSLALVPALSAFERHRQDVGDRVTLELASSMAKRAAELSAKAASLMGTSSALPERREALRNGPDGYMAALVEARLALEEVIAEMER